jgi:hypothetical protein
MRRRDHQQLIDQGRPASNAACRRRRCARQRCARVRRLLLRTNTRQTDDRGIYRILAFRPRLHRRRLRSGWPHARRPITDRKCSGPAAVSGRVCRWAGAGHRGPSPAQAVTPAGVLPRHDGCAGHADHALAGQERNGVVSLGSFRPRIDGMVSVRMASRQRPLRSTWCLELIRRSASWSRC